MGRAPNLTRGGALPPSSSPRAGTASLSPAARHAGAQVPCFGQLSSLHSSAMNLTQLTSADLQRIARLLEQKEALQAQVEGINRQLAAYEPAGADTATQAKAAATVIPTPRGKPMISVAGRARIAAAQKARWAKVKRLVQVHRQGRQGDQEGGPGQVRVVGLIAGDRAPLVPSSGDCRGAGVELRWTHG